MTASNPEGHDLKLLPIQKALEDRYPQEPAFLSYRNSFELMVAVALSAQTTDAQVNRVTPELFRRFSTPGLLAEASQEAVEEIIHGTGFFRAKARNIIAAAQVVVERFGGEVPATMDDLVTIPGLGRKSAGVVLHHIHGIPAIIVDTHFGRVVRRLGWSVQTDPVKLELDLARWLPRDTWGFFSMRLNALGRDHCHARKPDCGTCPVAEWCPRQGV